MIFHVLLICSDPACAEEIEAYGTRLEELEAIACECGCALQLLAVSEAAFAMPRFRPVVGLAA